MIQKYDDKTLEPLPLDLPPGTREHVLIPSDEVIFHTNDHPCQLWLKNEQQDMVYPADHPEQKLRGLPKGLKAVLEERVSVWDELMTRRNGKVNGKCKQCKKSQVKKDAERQIAEAEAMGREDGLTDKDLVEAEESVEESEDKWCCMYKVMSLQDDFVNEKPQLQHDLEARGHICLFLPKFHCELNPIELVWGYAKYCESLFSFKLSLYSQYKIRRLSQHI